MSTPPTWSPEPNDNPWAAPPTAPPVAPAYSGPQYAGPQYGAGVSAGADPYDAPAPGTDPGATPYGYGYAYGPGNTYAAQRTSGLAIASLVTSLSSLALAITAPIGLILGIIALNGIKRDGTQGRGLAIAGIVIGGLMTLALAGLIVLGFLFFAGMAAAPGGFS